MNPVRNAIERFELANKRHRLIKKEDRLVVAVSGGSDSMALLGLLLLVRDKYALHLSVAHLHHGLQKAGDGALRLVRDVCVEKDLRFFWHKTNVRSLAKRKKLSLEDAGRQARYDFLVITAKRTNSKKIVTAHTLDDQAETVLMRILRGSGVRGLSGIPVSRDEKGLALIRPLLSLRKNELVALVKTLRLPFINDAMNKDLDFLRNRVRHRLLPELRRINPQIDSALSDLQAVHSDLRRYMESSVKTAYQRAAKKVSRREVRFSAKQLLKMPAALRNEVLFIALSHLKGDGAGFGFVHIQAILDLLTAERKKGETHLPHAIRVLKNGGGLHLRLT